MQKLIIVPTPVGNLEDITIRAINTLKSVDLILAEDTRITGKLLKHFEIGTRMQSFHQHNEHKITDYIVEQLEQGKSIAQVSDAGTPGISDPGFLLVRECVKRGVEVECLPGATAFVPALVVSGLPCDKFHFEGFLPQKKGRNKRLIALQEKKETIVIYESPYKVVKTLGHLAEFLGANRLVSVSREISKLHEEHIRGTLEEVKKILEARTIKGEFVLVIGSQEEIEDEQAE